MPPVHIFARFLIGLFCLHQTALADTLSSYPNYTGQYPGFSLLVDERFDALDERIWKKGDGDVIDGSLNGLAMGFIPFITRLTGRAQSGYIFTYAFAMVIGIVVLVTWMTLSGGAH